MEDSGLVCRNLNILMNAVLLCRASYKGFADCIRLLLFMDASLNRADKEGMHLGQSVQSASFVNFQFGT